MLTIFTTAKPFKGHTGTIQRNALKSWTLLQPACQILLIGNDDGSSEVAREYQLTHIPVVERTDYGLPRIDALFALAEEHAKHTYLCYANADIILMQDFIESIKRVVAYRKRFLAVGKRWNLDVDAALKFADPQWGAELRGLVQQHGHLFAHDALDYFVFPRGLYRKIPPMGVGREGWDNWMIYEARRHLAPVIDITPSTTVVHQNHDYGKFKDAMERFNSVESQRNQEFVGKGFFDLRDATHELLPERLHSTWPSNFRWHMWRACLLFPGLRCLLIPLSTVKRFAIRRGH